MIKRKRIMKEYKKIASIIIVLALLIQVIPFKVFAASPLGQQKPVEKLTVVKDGIGFDVYDKYFVNVGFTFPTDFFLSSNTYLDFYAEAIPKPYNTAGSGRTLRDKEIRIDPIAKTPITHKYKDLKSGTIYYLDSQAYYKYSTGLSTAMQTSDLSEVSNRVKVLTDINISAAPVGANQLKIEWDDVWNSSGRISYELYVSDSPTFANTYPIYIEPADIGSDKPVRENRTTNKLEYIHTVNESGRIYYMKIIPRISDTDLIYFNPSGKIVKASSFILVKTTRLSTSGENTMWRLDWSPVVLGLNESNIKIDYAILKGITGSNEMPTRLQTLSQTSMLLVLSPGEEARSYFKIRAILSKNGIPTYTDVEVQSDFIYLREGEVAAKPPTPVFSNEIADVRATIEVDKATVIWKLPRKPTGEVDFQTFYDVWLVTDVEELSTPEKLDIPSTWDFSKGSFQTSRNGITYDFEYISSGLNVAGCKVVISGLNPNSSYYFRIEARKGYLTYIDNVLKLVQYSSDTALKALITPTSGDIHRPVAPNKPPLRIKKTKGGSEVVTEQSVVLQIDNRWYEVNLDPGNKTTPSNPDDSVWQFINTKKTYASPSQELPEDEDFNERIGHLPFDDKAFTENVMRLVGSTILPNNANNNNVKLVKYDDQVTIDVFYEKYDETKSYNDLENETKYNPTRVSGFKVEANDTSEDVLLNFPDCDIPDKIIAKRNVDLEIEKLEPNTTYAMWVRAVRVGTGGISDPSDAILVTTSHADTNLPEKPIVPTFNYNNASDIYIDLGWDYKSEYLYNIMYSKVESLTNATEIKNVDRKGKNYYRVADLEKNTVYYFWIQAESKNSSKEEPIKSDWSDAYPVATLPDVPPETPSGFGVKTNADAVGKNHVTYEWMKLEGMNYIIQIADNINYSNAKEYNAENVSEYQVSGLLSNHRYYARLYAFDTKKKLRSAPTQSVSVKTMRSSDDYDSDQDVENVVSGDFVQIDPIAIESTWNISVIGINAERFIEKVQTDNSLDYELDLTKPPSGTKKIRILMSSSLFDALTERKENLIISNWVNQYVVRPGMLNIETSSKIKNKFGDYNYEFVLEFPTTKNTPDTTGLVVKSALTGIGVNIYGGSASVPIEKLNKPLKTVYTYGAENWYKFGKTSGFVYEKTEKKWSKLSTSAIYDSENERGFMSFETPITGYLLAAETSTLRFNDVTKNSASKSISAVANEYELKSINGKTFSPDSLLKTGDAVKLGFDILKTDVGNDYMSKAVKAGMLLKTDLNATTKTISREKLTSMVMRIYELKSGEKATATSTKSSSFKDISNVNKQFLPRIRFAVNTGIITSRNKDYFGPRDSVTRGEYLVLLEKMLRYLGEI